MRTLIVIAALACSAVGAHAAEDRYGPPPAPRVLAVVGVAGQAQAAQSLAPTPYAGRMLGWTGKTAPRVVEPAPQPQYQPQPAPRYQPVARAPFQPQTPQPVPQQQTAALPQNLYDRPMAPPAPQYQPQVTVPRAAAPFQPQAAPAPLPAPQYAPQPSAQRVAAGDNGGARSYSVIREFGGQPDPIALPPPTSYWATREQAQPVLTDPTYGAGLSKKSGEAEASGGVGEDPAAAPRPERKREIKR